MTGTRRRRALVGAVGIGLFLLLFVGAAFLVRLGGPTSGSDERTGQGQAATTGRGADEADPTDLASDQPTEAGAIRAAIAYACAPQEWLYLSDDDIVDAVSGVATPASADRLSAEVVDEIRVARDELVESPGPVWWIVRPLAWRVESFDDTRATVAVWTMSLLSAADVAMPQADWTTTTLQLEWTDDGWHVAHVSDTAGPTPAIGTADSPWEPEPFADALDGFTRLTTEDFR